MHTIEQIYEIMAASKNIVAFTGAGISTESNIPDFRSDKGLYGKNSIDPYPPETMLSHSFFMEHTDQFYEYYKSNMIYLNAKPNDGHLALAELEKMEKVKAVITQNIDGLHQAAGSTNVLELHGSIYRNYCIKCRKSFDLNYIINTKCDIPKCDICGGVIKPDVVLYEEMLNDSIVENAVSFLRQADVLLVMGTSLVVYPAAGFLDYYHGNKLILINKTETQYDFKAKYIINESIGKVMKQVTYFCKKEKN